MKKKELQPSTILTEGLELHESENYVKELSFSQLTIALKPMLV